MQNISDVRIMDPSELGLAAWRSEPHGRRIVAGGFVKAGFASGKRGSGYASETLWVHVGAVYPSGQVAGVLDSVPAFFPRPACKALVLLRPSQIVSVLDMVTDWVPDLWESEAPFPGVGDSIDKVCHAFYVDVSAGGKKLRFEASALGKTREDAQAVAVAKVVTKVRERFTGEVGVQAAFFREMSSLEFCSEAQG